MYSRGQKAWCLAVRQDSSGRKAQSTQSKALPGAPWAMQVGTVRVKLRLETKEGWGTHRGCGQDLG